MGNTVSSVLVIANTGKHQAPALADDIAGVLGERGFRVERFCYDGQATQIPRIEEFDLAITLGGDGTVLFASRVLAEHQIPILPVNLGDFGFISEVGHDEWLDAFDRYLAGEIQAGPRLVLDVEVTRDEKRIASFRGLNDAVIASAGIAKIVRISVRLGDQVLGQYRADGIIIATPTGSTAYSAAAGGPILHPEMNAMIINPVSPFTLSHRPIVIPEEEVVNVSILENQRTSVALTVDGQSITELKPQDLVTIHASERRALIVRSNRRTFYEVLRSKLRWSGGSHD